MTEKEIDKAKVIYKDAIEDGLSKTDALNKAFDFDTDSSFEIYVFEGMFNYQKGNFAPLFNPEYDSSDYALMTNIETFEEKKIAKENILDFLDNYSVIYPNVNFLTQEEFQKAFNEVRCEYLNLLLENGIFPAINILHEKYSGRCLKKD